MEAVIPSSYSNDPIDAIKSPVYGSFYTTTSLARERLYETI
jgi:hypothetical protein